MWPILLNGLRLAASGAIGYFVNDAAAGINKLLPSDIQTKTKNANGGFAWWFLAGVMILLGVIVFFVLNVISGKGKKGKLFSLAALTALFYALDSYFGFGGDYIYATALVTLTTGAAVLTSANLAFLPERIAYAAATQLTGVKVTVQGDGVVFDSDANGLTHVGVSRVLGQVTNNYVLTLADSLMKAKNVLFEFTNSAAQTPVIYYDSDSSPMAGLAPQFLQMMKVPLLIGGNDFIDFATLSLPSLAAADSVTVLYKDGTVQANMNRVDLQYRLGYSQSVVNTPIYQIDNYNRNIVAVTVVCVAAQTGYMQRWAPSLSNSMVKGQDN